MNIRALLIGASILGLSAGAFAQSQTQVPATTSTRTTVGGQVDEKARAAEEALKQKAAEDEAKKKMQEPAGTKPKTN